CWLCLVEPIFCVTKLRFRNQKLIGFQLVFPSCCFSWAGSALTQEAFQLSPDMPMMQPAHLAWNCIGNDQGQELLFSCVLAGVRAVDECDYILCNSFRDAEAATFARFPKILPIGPLLTGERPGKPVGHFWRPEDGACMSWLDVQPARSVVYVVLRQLHRVRPAPIPGARPGARAHRPAFPVGGAPRHRPRRRARVP
ncbi:hypothetical protein EE612_050718, partial [Oryza sativa]